MDRSLSPEEVLRKIERRDLLTAPRIAPDGSGVVGDLDLGEQVVTVKVIYRSSLELPAIFLDPPDQLGLLPHLDREVCYQEKEGLLVDRRCPGRVLDFAVSRAKQVLVEGLSGENHSDFTMEFATIWNRNPTIQGVKSLINPRQDAHEVLVLTRNKMVFVVQNADDLRKFFSGDVLKRPNRRVAIYLPLEPGNDLQPPAPRGEMWTPEQVRDILRHGLSPENQRFLAKWVKGRKGKRIEYAFFGLHTGYGGHSVFGLKFVDCGSFHPLTDGGDARMTIPIGVRRWDRSFLLQRGGARVSLSEKRALLIGCGAVGSLIATESAHTGIGFLQMVDPDTLSEENSFRHVLGKAYWGTNKATALAKFINANVPYVEALDNPKSVETALEDGDVDFAAFDLIIFATGNATLGMHINELLLAMDPPPPAVFAWVEPLGIGGHALLIGTPGGGGCFECIFTSVDDSSEDLYRDRLSFAEPGQEFRRDLAGCGSLHTPYGFLDASRTATLAVSLGVRALLGHELRNVVEAWRGDPSTFRAEGFMTSARFDASDAQLASQRQWNPNPRCPVCESPSDG